MFQRFDFISKITKTKKNIFYIYEGGLTLENPPNAMTLGKQVDEITLYNVKNFIKFYPVVWPEYH